MRNYFNMSSTGNEWAMRSREALRIETHAHGEDDHHEHDHHDHDEDDHGVDHLHATAHDGPGGSVIHGSRWNGTEAGVAGGTVSWGYAPLADGNLMTQTVYRDAVAAAFAVWNAVANIDLVFAGNSSSADITLGWSSLNNNGPDDKVAVATWSHVDRGGTYDEITSVTIEFDTADFPANATAAQMNAGYFYQTALHEIGHAIGLGHSADPAHMMYPSVSLRKKELVQGDIAGIEFLYGTTALPPAAVPVPQRILPPEQTTSVRFNGTWGDDDFEGRATNDLFLVRFGEDRVAGNGGADAFVFDGRYVEEQTRHTIRDLNFADGDTLVFRSFEGGAKAVASMDGLNALAQSGYLDVTSGSDGTMIEVQTNAGNSLVVVLENLDSLPSIPVAPPAQPPVAAKGLVLNGAWNDDTLVGTTADDRFLLRFGDDQATGGQGADIFVVDSRYIYDGDAHRINDLNFAENDALTFRFFNGTIYKVQSLADLTDLIDESFLAASEIDDGIRLTHDAGANGFTLDLMGDAFEFI